MKRSAEARFSSPFLGALAELIADERERVEQALIKRLQKAPHRDSRVTTALGELRSAQEDSR